MITLEPDKKGEALDEVIDEFLDDDILEAEFEVEEINVDAEIEKLSREHYEFLRNDELGRYLAELEQFPRITAEEEIKLATLVQAGIKAKEALTVDNQDELTPIIKAGQAARERFINANYKLVVSIAKRFFWGSTASMSKLDIIQSGNLGLMKAVDRYDPTKGFKFSTYATNWIMQVIRRDLMNVGATIRIPIHIQDNINRIYRLEKQFGPLPIADLATRLQLSERKIERLIDIKDKSAIVYIDNPKHDLFEESTLMIEAIASEVLPPDKVNDLANVEATLYEVLSNRLTDREHYIINRRYGLSHGLPATLEVIGDELGLTRERVRQIESKAMFKLRSYRSQEILKSLVKDLQD